MTTSLRVFDDVFKMIGGIVSVLPSVILYVFMKVSKPMKAAEKLNSAHFTFLKENKPLMSADVAILSFTDFNLMRVPVSGMPCESSTLPFTLKP